MTSDWECSPGHKLPNSHGWKWFTEWWWGAKGFTRGCTRSRNVLKLDGMCRFLFNKDNFKRDKEIWGYWLGPWPTAPHASVLFFLICKFRCKRWKIMVREMKQTSLIEVAMILRCWHHVCQEGWHEICAWEETADLTKRCQSIFEQETALPRYINLIHDTFEPSQFMFLTKTN